MENSEATDAKLVKLGLNIQYYRKLRKMSQENLSEKSGISIAVIGRIEAANISSNPTMVTIFKIADALDVTPKTLFDFKDDN